MIDFFFEAYKQASLMDICLEFVAFVFGIISVWYARNENILVYPTGIICTVITMYLLYKANYFGDMMMNFYYSIMSIYGWLVWSLKKNHKTVVHIEYATIKEKIKGAILALMTMFITYIVYITYDFWGNFFTDKAVDFSEFVQLLRNKLYDPGLQKVQYIDIFTSGLFFTAMWYLATKKIENWVLWIIADVITIPLYAYRGLGMLSLQYFIFLLLAISGYIEWRKLYKEQQSEKNLQSKMQ